MPDKAINIQFNTNLAEVNKQQEKLNQLYSQQYSWLVKSEGMHKASLGDLYKQREAWSKIKLGADLTSDEIETINSNIGDVDRKLKGVENPFETLLQAATPFGGALIRHKEKLESVADAMGKVKQSGGFFNMFSDYLGNITSKVKAVRGGFSAAFGSGLKGMITSIGVGIKALIPVIGGLMAALGPILLVVGAIIAIVFVLQRVWKNNIGGIQTFWHKTIGKIKDAWQKFVVGFDKTLRKLEPLFVAIGKIMKITFIPLMVVLRVIQGVFRAIWEIVKPIIDAFAEIGKEISKAFGDGKKSSFSFWKALEGIAVALGWVGKVIGWVVKIGLMPLIWSVKIIIFLIKTLVNAFKWLGEKMAEAFKKSLAFKVLAAIFKGIGAAVKALIGFIKELMKPFKWILDGAKKIAKWLGFGNDETEEQIDKEKELKKIKEEPVSTSQVTNNNQRSSTVNNNNNVVVQSSGPITPESAPQIGNVISSSMTTGARVT